MSNFCVANLIDRLTITCDLRLEFEHFESQFNLPRINQMSLNLISR